MEISAPNGYDGNGVLRLGKAMRGRQGHLHSFLRLRTRWRIWIQPLYHPSHDANVHMKLEVSFYFRKFC